MANCTTDLLYSWTRFKAFAATQGFAIIDYGAQVNLRISQNEHDVVDELIDRLADQARSWGTGSVTVISIRWGSPNGGIRVRFSDPGQAALWKLSW